MAANKSSSLMRVLSDGLTGYLAYESRCGMNEAYSEYFLYSPIVRIANHRVWRVEAEWPYLRGKAGRKQTVGDHKRIDFLFRLPSDLDSTDSPWLALEVKWIRRGTKRLNVKNDIDKLTEAIDLYQDKKLRAFLLIAGSHQIDETGKARLTVNLTGISNNTTRLFSTCYQASMSTLYGVTVYEIK
ncbi:hypothetical protein FJY94_07885 [Candidatus Kaiserbacteria bacterium]|nr:hypothetical protein [Candidatus Kaiserbacteria bacterium]